MIIFTKTGSGQTQGKHSKKDGRFLVQWISPFKYIFTLMNINQWDGYGALGQCFCADGSVPTACSSGSGSEGNGCVPHTVRVCPADAEGVATTPVRGNHTGFVFAPSFKF